jgi:hypothetical protein
LQLTVPNLDDLKWRDFVEDGRSSAPAWSPAWTNHNVSDPGITLVELFAYFSEQLVYQLNRISDAEVCAFLRLINSPGWEPRKDLHQEKRATILELRRLLRAVTATDFEILALSVNEQITLPNAEKVARANVIPERNLESDAPSREAPGHVSVVIVSDRHSQPSADLLQSVRDALHDARLITTRVHVVRPRYVTIAVRLTLVPQWGVVTEKLIDEAVMRLEAFFDPLAGGLDKQGWRFGRNVYVSELYQVMQQIPGVDHVVRTTDPKTGDQLDELIVAPREATRLKRNPQHELEAVGLRPDELVSIWIDRNDISVSAT